MEGGEYSKVFSTVSSDNSVSFYDVACYGKYYSEAHICPLLGCFPSHPVPKQNPSQNPAALLTTVRTCQEKPFSVKRITLIYSQTCVQRAGTRVGTRAELLHPPPPLSPNFITRTEVSWFPLQFSSILPSPLTAFLPGKLCQKFASVSPIVTFGMELGCYGKILM